MTQFKVLNNMLKISLYWQHSTLLKGRYPSSDIYLLNKLTLVFKRVMKHPVVWNSKFMKKSKNSTLKAK